MGMFDFRGYSATQSVEMIETAHQLATYANLRAIVGNTALADIADDILSSKFISGSPDGSTDLPEGWRLVTAQELGVSPDGVDSKGFFTANSPVFNKVIPGGVQAQVMAEQDAAGTITRIALVWSGTSSIVDVVDYIKLLDEATLNVLRDLSEKTAGFAQAQGLSAQDVIVTGYSLGGANVATMANAQDDLADGFFQGAQFISHAGPLNSEAENFINVGYENDIVFRATGNFDTLADAVTAAGPFLEGSDFTLPNATSNVVLFDGAYASPLFPFGPFSLLNIPGSWYAHIDGVFTDAIERIAGSAFYDLTTRQSAVVVSNLGADLRPFTWVEDKATLASSDHFGKSAFLIGTIYDDKIRDGRGNDYIDLGAGDDIARLSSGYDVVDGGAGHDIVRLKGYARDWQAFQLSDGTLMLASEHGLKAVRSVETIEFEEMSIGTISNFNKSYSVTQGRLDFDGGWWASLFNRDVVYDEHLEGSEGADVLTGQVVFAAAGDDLVTGTEGDDLLHGGHGRDVLEGGAGDDSLYGAEHDDVLIASSGNDVLNGGHGDDAFVFRAGLSGQSVVTDFNNATDQKDTLVFDGIFGSIEAARAAAQAVGSDLVLHADALTIVLADTGIDDLSEETLVFI